MPTFHQTLWARVGIVAVVIGLLNVSVCVPDGVSAYEEEETQTVTPPRPSPSRPAPKKPAEDRQAEGRQEEIEKTLNQILKNQVEILQKFDAIQQRFDAVMEELRIIKVRATIRGS